MRIRSKAFFARSCEEYYEKVEKDKEEEEAKKSNRLRSKLQMKRDSSSLKDSPQSLLPSRLRQQQQRAEQLERISNYVMGADIDDEFSFMSSPDSTKSQQDSTEQQSPSESPDKDYNFTYVSPNRTKYETSSIQDKPLESDCNGNPLHSPQTASQFRSLSSSDSSNSSSSSNSDSSSSSDSSNSCDSDNSSDEDELEAKSPPYDTDVRPTIEQKRKKKSPSKIRSKKCKSIVSDDESESDYEMGLILDPNNSTTTKENQQNQLQHLTQIMIIADFKPHLSLQSTSISNSNTSTDEHAITTPIVSSLSTAKSLCSNDCDIPFENRSKIEIDKEQEIANEVTRQLLNTFTFNNSTCNNHSNTGSGIETTKQIFANELMVPFDLQIQRGFPLKNSVLKLWLHSISPSIATTLDRQINPHNYEYIVQQMYYPRMNVIIIVWTRDHQFERILELLNQIKVNLKQQQQQQQQQYSQNNQNSQVKSSCKYLIVREACLNESIDEQCAQKRMEAVLDAPVIFIERQKRIHHSSVEFRNDLCSQIWPDLIEKQLLNLRSADPLLASSTQESRRSNSSCSDLSLNQVQSFDSGSINLQQSVIPTAIVQCTSTSSNGFKKGSSEEGGCNASLHQSCATNNQPCTVLQVSPSALLGDSSQISQFASLQ